MTLGLDFWRQSDAPTAIYDGVPWDRLDADRHQVAIWRLGSVLHDASRDLRIAYKLRQGDAVPTTFPRRLVIV